MKAEVKNIVVSMLVASSSVWAAMPGTNKTGNYDFDYSVFGAGRSKPMQVFDDGRRTYLQYPLGSSLPVFISADGTNRYSYDIEGPYAVINSIPHDLIAQFGGSRTRIIHKTLTSNAVQYGNLIIPGPAPTTLSQSSERPSETAKVPNSWLDNSYAKPLKGDSVQWTQGVWDKQSVERVYFELGSTKLTQATNKNVAKIAADIGNAPEIVVVGSDDESYTEGIAQVRSMALKDALIRNGIDGSRISVRTTTQSEAEQIKKGKSTLVASFIKWRPISASVSPETVDLGRRFTNGIVSPDLAAQQLMESRGAPKTSNPVQRDNSFSMRMTDRVVTEMLVRWGKESGWTVVNQGAPEIKITGDSELKQMDFLKAAELVVSKARESGFKIKATAYQNQTLVLSQDESK